MEMRRTFDKEELVAAQADSAMLKWLVEASGGYVLIQMRKAGLSPSLEALMEEGGPLPASISFILDHYELSNAQKRKIAPLLGAQLAYPRLAGSAMTELEIDEALEDGVQLLRSAKLSLAQLARWQSRLGPQFELDENDATAVLLNSTQELGVDELLGLGRDFLADYPCVMRQRPERLRDPRWKELFKELTIEGFKNSHRRASLADFKSWPFEEGDEGFFWELVEAGRESWNKMSYADVSSIPGAAAFIDEISYARRVDHGSIKAMSANTLRDNLPEIRAIWLGKVAKEQRVSCVVGIPATVEQFEAVVDEQWGGAVLALDAKVDVAYFWDDSLDGKAKAMAVKRALMGAALNDPRLGFEALGSHGLGSLVRELGQERDPTAKGLALRGMMELLPMCLDSRHGQCAEAMGSFSAWTQYDSWSAKESDFAKLAKERPSANLLCMALSGRDKGNRGFSSRGSEALDVARAMTPWVDPRSARLLWAALAPGEQPGKFAPRGSMAGDSLAGNFLRAESGDLVELGKGMAEWLFEVDPDFISKMARSGMKPGKSLLWRALGACPERLDDMKALLSMRPGWESELPDFAEAIAAHPLGPLLREPVDAKEADDRACAELRAAISKIRRVDDARQKHLRMKKERGEGERMSAWRETASSPKQKKREKMEEDAKSAARSACSKLSFVRAQAEFSCALAERDYARYEWMIQAAVREDGRRDRWARHIEALGSRDVGDAMRHPAFRRMLAAAVGYGDEGGVQLDLGSARDNASLADAMREAFDTDQSRVLGLFSKSARAGFAPEWVLSNFPYLALYSYQLGPGSELLGGEIFTNEQTLRLLGSLDAGLGCFLSVEPNARVGSFSRANFTGREAQYLECLQSAKSTPKLYASLLNRDLCEEFAQAALLDGGSGMLRDELRARYIEKNFDWDVGVRGAREIFEEIERRAQEPRFDAKLAGSVVDAMVWSSYWEEPSSGGGDVVRSNLGERRSNALVDLLGSLDPIQLVGRRVLGVHDDAVAAFCARAQLCLGEDVLERVFYPRCARDLEGMKGSHRNERAERLLEAALGWMLATERMDDLEHLDWAVKEWEFREADLAGGHGGADALLGGSSRSTAVIEFLAGSPRLRSCLSMAMEKLRLSEIVADSSARRKAARRL